MVFAVLLILEIVAAYEHAMLFGNVENLGYYYVDIYVGTPPVKQTVIVDTASTLTAFPCTGCQKCGTHIDTYFDPALSSTASNVTCADSSCH
jgi:hypothetical protein